MNLIQKLWLKGHAESRTIEMEIFKYCGRFRDIKIQVYLARSQNLNIPHLFMTTR